MIPPFRHTITLAILALSLSARCSHTDDVAASPAVPAPAASPIIALFYAPDGKSLWSATLDRQLAVRANDGDTELYRGKLPASTSMLRVLKDGSLLAGTSDCALDWFEPPRAGEPLKLRREFDGPEARGIRKRLNPALKDTATDEEKMAAINNLQFNDLVVAPDEKRVAYSLVKGPDMAPIIYDTPTQEVIRVLNLESGQIESEQIVVRPTLSVANIKSDDELLGPITLDGSPGAKLAWADNKTLVVARGLTIARFDMAGKKLSEWKPANAAETLTRAAALRGTLLSPIAPAARETLIKSWQGRALNPDLQKALALSPDGTQLLATDDSQQGLLTLWNSATGEARILNDWTSFIPGKAKFSPDGTRVAAWDSTLVRSWSGKSEMSYPARENAPIWDIALKDENIAIGNNAGEVRSFAFGSEMGGKRPARLEDLRPVVPSRAP